MAKRPYYYKAQLLDAVSFLESGRPHLALQVLQTTLDVLDGKRPADPAEAEFIMLRMAKTAL
jgi:hypothetical protein